LFLFYFLSLLFSVYCSLVSFIHKILESWFAYQFWLVILFTLPWLPYINILYWAYIFFFFEEQQKKEKLSQFSLLIFAFNFFIFFRRTLRMIASRLCVTLKSVENVKFWFDQVPKLLLNSSLSCKNMVSTMETNHISKCICKGMNAINQGSSMFKSNKWLRKIKLSARSIGHSFDFEPESNWTLLGLFCKKWSSLSAIVF